MDSIKNNMIKLIEDLIEENIISGADLKRFTLGTADSSDPDVVHSEMLQWYIGLGIESIIGRKFELSECPFTREEIKACNENNEMILCIPKDVTREQFGKLFRLDSWALHDTIVTPVTEKSDLWIRTDMSLIPKHLRETGLDIANKYDTTETVNFSIERYMVFIGRLRYLTGNLPDSEYWIWLPSGRYDRSGMLMAGFDRNGRFNVHGWMPQFSAAFLGARYGIRAKQDK